MAGGSRQGCRLATFRSMQRLRPCLFILALLVAESSLASQPTVVADIANVRQDPRPNARVVARLVTGTAVDVLDSSEGWVKVRFGLGQNNVPTDAPGHGWMHRGSLHASHLTMEILLDLLRKARRAQDSIRWLERLWWFRDRPASMDSSLRRELEAKYRQTGDTARERWIRQSGPRYLAKPFGRAVRLLGMVDDRGEYRSLMWKAHAPAPEPKPENVARAIAWTFSSGPDRRQLGLDVAPLRWTGMWRGSTELRFPAPFEGPSGNAAANASLGWEVFDLGGELVGHGALVLDTLVHAFRPGVLTTAIGEPFSVHGPRNQKEWNRVLAGIDSVHGAFPAVRDDFLREGTPGVRAWFLPTGHLDLTLTDIPAGPDADWKDRRFFRAILDSLGAVLWPSPDNPHIYRPLQSADRSPHDEDAPLWWRLQGLPSFAYVVVPVVVGGMEYGTDAECLLRLGPEGIKSWMLWNNEEFR